MFKCEMDSYHTIQTRNTVRWSSMLLWLHTITNTDSLSVVKRRSVRVARRQVASRNPLKALAAREDIKSEYVEVKMGTGEKELRRMKVEECKCNTSIRSHRNMKF